MKTTMRLILITAAVIFSAETFAQNSVNDLFNTYVIVPAQQRIQILTDELSQVNAQIMVAQDELVNEASAASAEAGNTDPDIVVPASPLVAQIADLQARAAELQNTLSYWQAQLAAWSTFNISQMEQYLLAHSNEIATATGNSVASLLANPLDRLGPMPVANNPLVVPVFVSTGDAQQDAQLVLQWLYQHGLVDGQ